MLLLICESHPFPAHLTVHSLTHNNLLKWVGEARKDARLITTAYNVPTYRRLKLPLSIIRFGVNKLKELGV